MGSLSRFVAILAILGAVVWLTSISFTNLAFAANGYSYILTRCRTEGNLSISFFIISSETGPTVQTDYLVEFVMSGDNPYIGVDIEWYGNKTNAILDKATVTVFSSLFSMQNGSSQRIFFWDDPYYSGFFPKISKDEIGQYTCSYSFNLTSQIKEAEAKFASKTSLTNASQSYLGARIFFTTLGIDAIREKGQERRLEFSFQNDKINSLVENIFLYEISVSIPDDSEFINKPTLNDVEMNKILKRVEGFASVSYSDLTNYKAVVEWKVPSVPPWWQIPPASWVLSALLGVIIVSTPVSLATAYLRYRFSRPNLSIELVQRSAKEPAIHPRTGMAFYHLAAVNKGKTTAFDSEIHFSFKGMNGKELFSLTGKWDRGPEPLGPIKKGYISAVWPSLIPFGERVNIRPAIPETFCIVVKDKEDPCYAFSGESYLFNYKNPKWQLPLGNFIVDVEIKSGNAKKASKLLLKNEGNTVHDVTISKLNSPSRPHHDSKTLQ